tara:strand:+ start:4687 stop:5589 length:903 start_codon:yes stop_codon:yes gene_type:complete
MKDISLENVHHILLDKLTKWLTEFIDMLPNIAVAVVIIVAFYFISKAVKNVFGKVITKVSGNLSLNRLMSNTISLIIMTIGLFFALGVLNLDKTVTSLLAGVGVIGLALGFAFQDTAANFMSGIFLAVQKTFRVGEVIESNGYMGTVKEISLRATTIHNFDGQEIILPNKDVFQSAIENYSDTGRRRVELSCGISYGDDLEKVKKIATQSIEGSSFLDPNESISFFYSGFGDSSINFSLYFWINNTTQVTFLEARSEAIMKLKKAFDQNDIMIPFPIRTLDFGIKGGEKLNTMLSAQKNL